MQNISLSAAEKLAIFFLIAGIVIGTIFEGRYFYNLGIPLLVISISIFIVVSIRDNWSNRKLDHTLRNSGILLVGQAVFLIPVLHLWSVPTQLSAENRVELERLANQVEAAMN